MLNRIRTLTHRLAATLRRDEAAADPIVAIATLVVSLIVGLGLVGLIGLIMRVGFGLVIENQQAATMAQVRSAFALDATDASVAIQMGDQRITFYDMPGRHPGTYVERPGDDGSQCRKSVWEVDRDASRLTNTVTLWHNATCDLEAPVIDPASSGEILRVEGYRDVTISSWNAAGRDLHFDGTDEVGLASGSSMPSTVTRAPWWRDYEWTNGQPGLVNIEGTYGYAVQGDKLATISGATQITAVAQGETLDSPEDQPDITGYDPDGVLNVQYTRSSSVGAIYTAREGLDVWFGQVRCGPYSTEYSVTVTPTTPGATTRHSTTTSFNSPQTQSFDLVPNGSQGTITVTASCPADVSQTPLSATIQYVQSLPAPMLSAAAESGAPERHVLAWSDSNNRGVSSLPATYTIRSSTGGAFAVVSQGIVSGGANPLSALGATVGYPMGSAYGQGFTYEVEARVALQQATSNQATVMTPWPAVTAPAITASVTATDVRATVTNDATISCPGGTTKAYSYRSRTNAGTWSAWSSWTASSTSGAYTTAEGQLYGMQARVRCEYSASNASSPVSSAEALIVQPIVTAPTPRLVSLPNGIPPVSQTTVRIEFSATGCPADTVAQFQSHYALDDATKPGYSAWPSGGSSGSVSTSPLAVVVGATSVETAVQPGHKISVQSRARCVSPYATGPVGGSRTDDYVRPIETPGAPSVSADSGGSSGAKPDRLTWSPVYCPPGTVAQYRAESLAGGMGTYGWYAATAQVLPTVYGTTYTMRVTAKCVTSLNGTTPQTTPYAESATSSGQTSWNTPTPNPTGAVTISLPGSAYAGSYFGVYTGGAVCASGTSVDYWIASSGGYDYQLGGGTSMSDYWSNPGSYSYQARARCVGSNGVASPSWAYSGTAWISILLAPPVGPNVWIEDGGAWGGYHAWRILWYWQHDSYSYTISALSYQNASSGGWSVPSVLAGAVLNGGVFMGMYGSPGSVPISAVIATVCANNAAGTACTTGYWP